MNRQRVRDMLVKHEGIRLHPYRCPAGKLTIGIGRNIEDAGISEKEAFYLLDNDINECIGDLSKNLFPFSFDLLPGPVQEVLVSMRFQLGAGGFRGFKKMIRAVRDEDWPGMIREMKDSNWHDQVPKRAGELIKMIEGL
mgnify:FL=1